MTDIERWQRVDALFDGALALPPAERAAYLDASCAGDEALRQQVEALLQAHDEADAFLEAPPIALAGTAPRTAPPGEVTEEVAAQTERRVGPYRLLRPLGEGGMGEVFLAERADGQFVQRVAIKRIRGGFAFGAANERFRLERQILARLEHPHITRLLDGGVDDEGCPYLVMEYVEGTPITQHCDAERLSVEQRLQLFRTVCLAVHHAHRNLIVHRDLKPNNILVTGPVPGEPGNGTVKLLDFGIAKLLDPTSARRLGDDGGEAFPLVVTQSDMRMMTPGYASPEQVRGEPITTASDVYALGVLLYELLTGRMPYRFTGRSLQEVERVICETMPEKPSTAVVRPHVAQARPEVVGLVRGTTTERLRRRLRGDLDTIVLMALRKEPERRYASAEQLADDVARYLQGRPVRAQRDTFAYRATRFVQRNRLGVAAACAVVLALVGGLGAAAWQARIATHEAARAQHLNTFLLGMLASADPHGEGRSVTVAQVLDAAAAQLDEKMKDQPELEVDIRSTLGLTYRGLGLYAEAEPHLRRAIALRRRLDGPEHPTTAFELNRLGMLLNDLGRAADAEAVFREALAIERRTLDPDDERLGQLLSNLALAAQKQGRFEQADTLYREAVAILYADTTVWNTEVSTVLNGYAALLHAMGRLPEAAAYFRRVLERERAAPEPDRYSLAVLMNNLSQVLQLQGAYAEAEPILREAVTINRELLGNDHPEVALYLANLASLLQDRGNTAEAESLYQQALDIQRRTLGPDHPDVAHTLNNVASMLRDRGDFGQAETMQREAVAILRASYGEAHPVTAVLAANLGRVLHDRGRLDEAEAVYRRSLAVLRETLPDHPYLARALVGLGAVLVEQDRAAEAEPLLREGLGIRQAALPEGDWQIAQAESALGAALARLGRTDEARPLLRSGYETLRARRRPDDPELRRARLRLEESAKPDVRSSN